jgi:hypothetical protein
MRSLDYWENGPNPLLFFAKGPRSQTKGFTSNGRDAEEIDPRFITSSPVEFQSTDWMIDQRSDTA